MNLPDFQPDKFPQGVLSQFEIVDSKELTPPEGLVKLGSLLTVNEECRNIFEQQVGMSVKDWFMIANLKFGLG